MQGMPASKAEAMAMASKKPSVAIFAGPMKFRSGPFKSVGING